MHGPLILARSLSQPQIPDQFGNVWQYHPRSDRHSKIACWTLLFDLLENCALLRQHVSQRKVGYGINHEMRDFRTARKKNLDLVLCTPRAPEPNDSRAFSALVEEYGIVLEEPERVLLETWPVLGRVPVGSVHLALEAKACMTAHIKALPRLYDELNSSHLAIHGSADFAIAAGFAVVNFAATFVSPDRNRRRLSRRAPEVTKHRQPNDTERTIAKLEEIPRRTQTGAEGFDALGIVVIQMRNDGSPVGVLDVPPAPAQGDVWHYDQMIRRIASLYATKFGHI